jgi:hypothetical protein
MGAITQIAWCDATFNPWVGCLRVSTACDRCYAAALSWRYGWRDGNGRNGLIGKVQAVVEQVREAEMVQAIDRLRLIHSERKKTVCILCNIPIDIPVDALVTWRQLAGDGRLARALEACEENGWEALPLAPGKLSELLPELWGTESAAEAWLRKNRLTPSISIIRLWAVFVEYKPKRQRRWSKALVRHGADPRIALAAVLGAAAEDIHIREAARSDPLVNANTAPSPRPTSNPSPSTHPSADPSTGEPGFPSGDN